MCSSAGPQNAAAPGVGGTDFGLEGAPPPTPDASPSVAAPPAVGGTDFGLSGPSPLSDAIQGTQVAPASAKTPFADTKLGRLLKVLEPALEGGAIGALSGKGHPGGGFGAANDFYAQRRQQQIQQAVLQRQVAQTQAQIKARQDANAIAQQRADNEDWGQPIAGQDAQGNPAYFVRNRRTGETKQVNGFAPPDKADKSSTVMTDQGLMSVTGTTATPVTLPGAPSMAPTMIPGGPPGVPGLPLGPPAQARALPLHAPGFGKPQHESDFSQFYDEYLDDNDLDDTAANRLKARAAYNSAGRKPESDGSLTGAAYTKRQGQYIDQLNRGFASSEQQRAKDLKALAKDPTLTPDELAAKQQQIEEDNADRKQTLHQRMADAASSQGIDIGDVPDYRAQLSNGGRGGAPNAPPNAARANSGKVAGPADVAAWAKKKGISVPAARRQFAAKGYAIQGSPQ
jgi:hypothetical protein